MRDLDTQINFNTIQFGLRLSWVFPIRYEEFLFEGDFGANPPSSIEYRLISKKGEGTFSEVLKAQSIKTGKYVAIKCMKAHFYNIDQVRAFAG